MVVDLIEGFVVVKDLEECLVVVVVVVEGGSLSSSSSSARRRKFLDLLLMVAVVDERRDFSKSNCFLRAYQSRGTNSNTYKSSSTMSPAVC